MLAAIRSILARHNRIEEGPGGVYETCARLAGAGLDELVARLRAAPEVPVNATVDDERGTSAGARSSSPATTRPSWASDETEPYRAHVLRIERADLPRVAALPF
ncbi:MAG: hypothetical protein ABIR79_03635 [Candidatus Binatia bacterium]